MRGVKAAAGAAAAMTVVGSLGTATPANASNYGVELNGTYRVISNGEWAKTNEVFIDEPTVVQTWTMSSTCTSPISCTGTVTSDQGWSAPLLLRRDYWTVTRDVANWMPCPDGTSAPGNQKFLFWGVTEWGQREMTNVNVQGGFDTTKGPSGACGVNKQLIIQLPLRLEKLS
jgi:hypothetical protein